MSKDNGDYEFLGNSQMPAAPVTPHPPSNAPSVLVTKGLPHTPALKSHDDVDLESNRPSKNNIAASDTVNPKRSQSSVGETKTKSSESDSEGGAKRAKQPLNEERDKGACCYLFAAITICLAVGVLLGLGAFFLLNVGGDEVTNSTVSSTTVAMAEDSTDGAAVALLPAAKLVKQDISTSTAARPAVSTTPATSIASNSLPTSTTPVDVTVVTDSQNTEETTASTSDVITVASTVPVSTEADLTTTAATTQTSTDTESTAATASDSSTVVTQEVTTNSSQSISTETAPSSVVPSVSSSTLATTESTKTTAADSSIENALGDEPSLSVHSLNRAICVLIAKVDRFYSQVCRQLCLPALHDLCVAIVSSSENRVFYSAQKHIHLTAPASLLSRISDIISTLSHRPLIHQMIIYPLVSAHFVKVCQSDQESRIAATALAEVATRLLVTETPGLCFNQTLIVPFQTASCSESCSEETKEQMLCALSQLVLSQADKIGSGWKPLFGSLKAVSAARDEKVHWCAIDVISSYLRIDSPAVLSFSILECVPCVVNLLQNSEDSSEVSSAALRLLPNIYSLILYLYSTPHIPNYHLLHRSDLRSKCLDTVELDQDPVTVPHGPLPWDDKQTYEIAAVELFLTFMDQLCGTLLTSSPNTQKHLLDMIGRLLVDISTKPLGADSGGVCMSAVILPYVQKWIRRPDVEEVKILKQVIGACTQTVIDMVELEQMSSWFDRLLRDICALIVECVLFDKTCAVAPAYFTLIAHNSMRFSTQQWRIFSHFLASASSQSLRHIRLLNSFFVRSSTDENGDIGDVTSYNPGKLSFQQLIAAAQVFSSKRERTVDQEEEDLSSGVALLMLSHGADTHRLEVSSIISTLFTHCLFLQLVASLLVSEEDPKLKSSLIGSASAMNLKLDDSIYPLLYELLNESSETSSDFDSRPAVGSLLSRMIGIEHANLLKMLVSSNLIKTMSLLRRFEQTKNSAVLLEVASAVKLRSADLKSVELEVSTRKSAMVGREHAITQFHLVPVENGDENAYRLVSQTFVDDTLSEYDKHRDRLKPFVPDRRNPFQQAIDDADPSAESEKKEDFDEVRLAAHRDICLIPLRYVVDQLLREHLPDFLPAVTQVVLASPDLAVRQLSVDFIARLA